MENPYQILRRFIKWELMDLEAMIETIESKNDLEKRRAALKAKKVSNMRELDKMQRDKSFVAKFKSKNSKINRITDLSYIIE
jgi:hypothetical protein